MAVTFDTSPAREACKLWFLYLSLFVTPSPFSLTVRC